MSSLGIKGFSCVAAISLLTACTSIQPVVSLAPEGGLHSVETKDGAALRVAGVLNWSAVHVSEVIWEAKSEISPEDKTRLGEVLRDALRHALQETPSKEGRAIQIRARIDEVLSASPALNAASTILLFIPLDRGGASVRIEAFDQLTGQRLASLTMAATGQLKDFSGHFSRYGHAEQVLLRAATAFRELLEKENG